MRKDTLCILAIAACMMALTTEARSLEETYTVEQLSAPPRLQQQKNPEAETEDKSSSAGIDPLVGRNFISVILTDLINVLVAPGTASFVALFFDLFNFVAMPIVGGLVLSSVSYNYDQDAITYKNAEITKADMYASQMKLVKTTIYKGIGKPNFFGKEAAYQPPQETSFVGL